MSLGTPWRAPTRGPPVSAAFKGGSTVTQNASRMPAAVLSPVLELRVRLQEYHRHLSRGAVALLADNQMCFRASLRLLTFFPLDGGPLLAEDEDDHVSVLLDGP